MVVLVLLSAPISGSIVIYFIIHMLCIFHFRNEAPTLMTSFPVHSNGSLVIQATLDFDLDQLEKLVKKGGSVPSEATISKTIAGVLILIDDDVTVQPVHKEPKSRECPTSLLAF